MSEYTEESLNRLTKPELVALTLKVCKKMETLNDDLASDMRKLNDCFKRVESDLAVTKNVNELLVERLEKMERQCWANAQYSQRECLEFVGIPDSVKDENLEGEIVKVVDKIGVTLDSRDIQACHRIGKEGRTIVKFSNRKDSQLVLQMKREGAK